MDNLPTKRVISCFDQYQVAVAGPDGSFKSTGACNLDVPGSNPGRGCGCAYTVLQTVQRPGVYGAAYGTLHYK